MVTEQPRMSRLPRVFVVVVGLSLIATLGVGCKQGEGERCEQSSDCASGLTCSRMEVSAEAGRCRAPGSDELDAATGGDQDAGSDAGDDAAGTTDAAGTDASDDAPVTSDANSSDATADAPSSASDATVD